MQRPRGRRRGQQSKYYLSELEDELHWAQLTNTEFYSKGRDTEKLGAEKCQLLCFSRIPLAGMFRTDDRERDRS